MKVKKINLLTGKRDYLKIDRIFQILRRGTAIYSVLFFIFVIFFLFFNYQQAKNIEKLAQNEQLLSAFGEQQDQEAKLIYIAGKVKAYDKFIKDDAKFFPYYELLTDTLNTGSESGQLESLTIDKDREVTFELKYSDFNRMISSFRFIESAEFLKNFENVSLTDFATDSKEGKTYRLSFKGKFKQIK